MMMVKKTHCHNFLLYMNLLLILFVVVIVVAAIIFFMNFKSGGAKPEDIQLLCTSFNYRIVGQTIKHRDFEEGRDVRQLNTADLREGKIENYCSILRNLEIMQFLTNYFARKYGKQPVVTYYVTTQRQHKYESQITQGNNSIVLSYDANVRLTGFENVSLVIDTINGNSQQTFNNFCEYMNF